MGVTGTEVTKEAAADPTPDEWLACAALASTVLRVGEIVKAVRRRRRGADRAIGPPAPTDLAPAATRGPPQPR